MTYLRCEELDDLLILHVTVPKVLTDHVAASGDILIDYCQMAADSHKKIILDFHDAQFLSSHFLGILIRFNLCLKKHDVDLRLRSLGRNNRELFEMLGFDQLFEICEADDPDPFGEYRFEPDLFEIRSEVLGVLQERGYEWMTHFQSVELLHKRYGVEVGGISEKDDANAIQQLLTQMYPCWKTG